MEYENVHIICNMKFPNVSATSVTLHREFDKKQTFGDFVLQISCTFYLVHPEF